MDKNKWSKKLVLYDRLVAMTPNIKRKGKTMPYTSDNGYMFSLLNKDGEFGIRLPKDQAQQFIANYDSGPFKSYGATMRDYVLVPDELFDDLEILSGYLKKSHEYVLSLPPK